MITYSERLYTGNGINEKKINKIKRRIKQGRGQIGLHMIALSNNQYDQLDIINVVMFKQRLYRKFDIKIAGIAKSYDDAIDLVQTILDDTIRETGTVDMKAYLMKDFME